MIKLSMFIVCFVERFVFYFGYGGEFLICWFFVNVGFFNLFYDVEIFGGILLYLEVEGVGII